MPRIPIEELSRAGQVQGRVVEVGFVYLFELRLPFVHFK